MTSRSARADPAPGRWSGAAIAALAVDCLAVEVDTWPKPGLVSRIDAGSHADMDARTFELSAAALRPHLAALAEAGRDGAGLGRLRGIGLAAEAAMMTATGGVNTHRGAIFGLGLLCAAAGARSGHRALLPPGEEVSARDAATDEGRTPTGPAFPLVPAVRTFCPRGEKGETGQSRECGTDRSADVATLGRTVARLWGREILDGPAPSHSHGAEARRLYRAGGARAEAAAGFPTLYSVGLPALAEGRRLAPGDAEAARVHCCFALIASLEDTNLLHRGGPAGLAFARGRADAFLRRGGVGAADWRARALEAHRAFVARRLSPGGSADLLAMALFAAAWGTAP